VDATVVRWRLVVFNEGHLVDLTLSAQRWFSSAAAAE
jgi:hypothetical protein